MKSESNDSVSTDSKPRNRQVSSRFMSASPTSTAPSEPGSSSPTEGLSPVRRKPGFTSADSSHHHRSLEDSTFSLGQHWVSSAKRNSGTLADHIGNDRLREHLDREKSTKTTSFVFSLSKQRSCRESELKSFEKDRKNNNNNNNNGFKENDQPIIGGSMRYTGKFSFPGKSSTSCVKKPNSNSNDSGIVPGRLSFDENALYKKSLSSRRNSDCFINSVDSESDCFNSPTTTSSSRKLGRVVSSKYMSDGATRAQRGTSDSDISNPLSSDDSSMMKKFTIPKVIKRANSLIGYKSSKSQWALSPGRSGSPSISVESKEKPLSFSSLRPPNKSVEKILSMGFDLFRTKKSSSSPSSSSSPMGFGNSEAVHKLRLLDNRLIQWRFANARAQAVNENLSHQAQSNLIYALDDIAKLQHSVLQKKIYSLREKLEMKLNFVLYSQMKLLETWGGMERQHLAAIIVMKECLHSVVSKVPLLEGAKVEIQSASVAQRHASDLTASVKSVLTSFSPAADKTAELISELAAVVAQEKLLLQEFFDLFQTICVLELKERSLKCSLIQLKR